MSKMIFVNLPVADLGKSIAFYEALGFTRNPMFSDDTAACMVLSDVIHVMILTHAKWASFTDRPIAERGSSEVMLCITCDSKDEVNTFVEAGAAKGGSADINPPQDHGFMYQRTLVDPDGHVWEPVWMDMAAFPADASEAAPA